MQIVLFLVSILAAIGIWSWRIRMAREGAQEAAKLAQSALNMPRKLAFRYKAGKGGLSLIQDPREAAAIMMMEVARARGGPLTEKQTAIMDREIMQHFEFTQDEADELTAHAAWVTNSAPTPGETMRKLSQLIVASSVLGPKEIIDLDDMLVTISEAEGLPTREQLKLLQVYRDKAGLLS
jgi:type II secretory pathway pseudopilin PulG